MDGAHFDVPGQGLRRGVTRRSGWAPPGPAGSPSSPIASRGEGREPAVRAFAAASAVGGGGVARGSAVATATAAGGTALTGLTASSGRARASPPLAAPAAGTTPPALAAPAAGATFAVGGIGLARLMRRRALPGSQLRQHRAGGDHGGVVLGSDTGLAHQVVHIALLVRGLHRDHGAGLPGARSEEHTSELQSRGHLVCRLLPETK